MDTTVAKAMKVLEMLVRSPSPVRLSAISQELGLQKSNAHRTLATLGALGYVLQDEETGRYRPSLKLFELGAKVIADHPAKRAAVAYMQELHKLTGETVNLAVLDGTSVLILEKLVSPRPLRFTTQAGSRIPAPLTAAGIVLLAYEPDPRTIIEASLADISPAIQLDVDDILERCDLARRDGYAETTSSWTPGIFSIACPILRHNRTAAAAIGVSGPIERQDEESRARIIESVLTTSARIAENVGLL